jgi:serine protease Do
MMSTLKYLRHCIAKTAGLGLLALFALSFVTPAQAQNRGRTVASLADLSDSLQQLSSRISPSVVQITAAGYGLQSDSQRSGANVLSRERSAGSGVIVSADGDIMTNAHVIGAARTIRVKVNGMSQGQSSVFEAKLIGMDRLLDLALLKIEATGLKDLSFGSSIDLKQGELVLAFGSPLGMDNSVSMGIVSAPVRQLSEDDPRIFIQTDAPINPGNSGGPLVDAAGRLVGLNTFIFSQSGGSEGLGFAIPSNVVRYVYASLKKDGHVHRGQIGIFARTVTTLLASAFNLEPDNGVLLEDVVPGGPADKAGLQVGDVVLSLGGRPLRNVRDLSLELYQYRIGDTVQLQVARGEKVFETTVAVTESQGDPERFADMVNPENNLVSKLGILGLTIDDKVLQVLSDLRLPGGVLVAAQTGAPSYFGDQPKEGDVIHAVNGRPIASVETLRSELERLKSEEPLVLQVERENSLMFLVLETN